MIAMISLATVSAQELEWSVDMNAVINNREGGNDETPDQTFIFTRITPQIGVSMDSARHRIMGGVTWYQPMNDHLHSYKVLPALYYQFKDSKRGLEFKFGMIPNELDTRVPTYLRSDSINYVQPNIKGAVIRVDRKHFWLYSWLDWRQFQTNHHREAFDATAQLGWRTFKDNNCFALSTLLRYNHLAKSKQSPIGEGVVDNEIFSPQVHYKHFWDNGALALSAGMLMSFDRDRSGDNEWLCPVGFIGTAEGNWKWISLKETIYAGERQMPLYEKFGSLLYQGDQYYHNKFYSRTDLVATIFSRPFVNLEARLTFHATDKTTGFWQQVAVRFFVDQDLWKSHKKKRTGVDCLPLQSQF